jgi:hypothetical protein
MESEINISTLLRDGEDIVISGIGGRFPESDTMDEFGQNLFNKVDMITGLVRFIDTQFIDSRFIDRPFYRNYCFFRCSLIAYRNTYPVGAIHT